MWSQVIQTISAALAAVTFLYGVNAWRRTMLGQKRADIAVQTIIAFREVEQAFHAIRFPGAKADEGASRKPRPGESEEETKLAQQAFVAIERIDSHSDAFVKIQGLRYLFEAYFGGETLRPFDEVIAIRNDIFRAALRLENHWKRQGRPFRTEEEFERHLENMHAAEAIFWEGYCEPDPLSPRIEAMIDEISAFCREVVDPRPNILKTVKSGWKKFERFWLCR